MKDRTEELVEKYLNNTITNEEKSELLDSALKTINEIRQDCLENLRGVEVNVS